MTEIRDAEQRRENRGVIDRIAATLPPWVKAEMMKLRGLFQVPPPEPDLPVWFPALVFYGWWTLLALIIVVVVIIAN